MPKTKKSRKYSSTIKKTDNKGMIHYNNSNHPKHLIKSPYYEADCGPQVLRLLKFTDMETSKYLQQHASMGLSLTILKNMIQDSYPGNGFTWYNISRHNINDLHKYIKPNQGSIIFIDCSPIHRYDIYSNVNSHYVAIFRKNNKKVPQLDNYFIRDPQERTTAYTLKQFFNKWEYFEFYILVRETPVGVLKPYGVTKPIIDKHIISPSYNSNENEHGLDEQLLTQLFHSGTI